MQASGHPGIYFERVSFLDTRPFHLNSQINTKEKWENMLTAKQTNKKWVSPFCKPFSQKSLLATSSHCSRTLLCMHLDMSHFDKGSLALGSINRKSKPIIGILINNLAFYYGAGGV